MAVIENACGYVDVMLVLVEKLTFALAFCYPD